MTTSEYRIVSNFFDFWDAQKCYTNFSRRTNLAHSMCSQLVLYEVFYVSPGFYEISVTPRLLKMKKKVKKAGKKSKTPLFSGLFRAFLDWFTSNLCEFVRIYLFLIPLASHTIFSSIKPRGRQKRATKSMDSAFSLTEDPLSHNIGIWPIPSSNPLSEVHSSLLVLILNAKPSFHGLRDRIKSRNLYKNAYFMLCF